ncbi:GNAT family N-acetyltransferase [Nocardioides sp.]|uniref:GNAT family N-acetyltransferase n=1 Tax=Nocardioides sp. TaxID=35761 RepID=UPI0019CAC241|nr:GNAT family N-acetyltransferase [Nocardioides sp.]MBC7275171.1 GNAT family N-acetyltransferase [Nocardioides sp.]
MTLREARVDDALFLLGIWQDSLRMADAQDQLGDLETIIRDAGASPDQRLLVAECGGEAVGAVYLRATTFGPLNLEPTVQIFAPHVVPSFRRRGVGRKLMEAAVVFAEERGVRVIAAAGSAAGRDGNRFLARLGLGAQAVMRVAPTAVVRSRLNVLGRALPHHARMSRSPKQSSAVGELLAARRSQRRSNTVA